MPSNTPHPQLQGDRAWLDASLCGSQGCFGGITVQACLTILSDEPWLVWICFRLAGLPWPGPAWACHACLALAWSSNNNSGGEAAAGRRRRPGVVVGPGQGKDGFVPRWDFGPLLGSLLDTILVIFGVPVLHHFLVPKKSRGGQ